MTARHLVLVGLMAAGKSSVGQVLAERLDRPFVDTDDVITARTGQTVRELWEAGGEEAYRGLESEVVRNTLGRNQPVVLAAPGGAVLDATVRALLVGDAVTTVWLRAQIATLARRVGPDDHRPLLGDHPSEVLTRMAIERSSLLAEVSDLVVDVDDLSAAAVAAAILGLAQDEEAGPARGP